MGLGLGVGLDSGLPTWGSPRRVAVAGRPWDSSSCESRAARARTCSGVGAGVRSGRGGGVRIDLTERTEP